ncbi:ImmA/IrrE family metallo-endopeptidase [Aeromicrobium sp. Marseille-Q0843]|uniref:ImmA/IrrE family metallo-endopeptidase n=1 Tax=Aeromicrobium phoceense TaxID=2754045 RepID=A0A838XKH3_9ACTN|nr:ImmA/IrrE family metallo-endopeptidase [Aeromicrobium phoceense]
MRGSAALIPVGRSRIIVENDSHHTVRRRSSVAHEMSHHSLSSPRESSASDHDRLCSTTVEKLALFMSGQTSSTEGRLQEARVPPGRQRHGGRYVQHQHPDGSDADEGSTNIRQHALAKQARAQAPS